MTYSFPEGLHPLRDWLTRQGLDEVSIKSERHAAFMAQQLAGTRFKFPLKGKSCFRLLQSIQDRLPEEPAVKPGEVKQPNKRPSKQKPGRRNKKTDLFEKREEEALSTVHPTTKGLVIYADGACEPNPGAGGWGFVVYRNGVEIHADYGGDVETTNQRMELTAALMALRWFAERGVVEPVRLLSDSKYTVNGCNSWRLSWKARGWKRKGKNPEIISLDLWQALDEALTLVPITLEWVKGHAGIEGNERADELALMGRGQALEEQPISAVEQQLAYEVT